MNQIRIKGIVNSVKKEFIPNSENRFNFIFMITQPSLKQKSKIIFKDIVQGKKKYDCLNAIKVKDLVEVKGTVQQVITSSNKFKAKWIWIGHTKSLSLNN